MEDISTNIKLIINEIEEQGILEAMGDGISIQDTNYRVLYQNQIHKRFVGEHIGEFCYKAYEKKEQVCDGCPVAMAFKDGKTHTEERSAPTERGISYFEITASPLKDKNGKIIAGIEIARDITENKMAKEKLQGSERKYRLLFENLTVGFALHEMIYDEKGHPADYRFLEINPAFERLTGIPASALIGKTVKEVLPNTEQYWIDVSGKVVQTGEPIAYQNYSRELSRYYDTWLFRPSPNKFAVVFSDITERKQAEEKLTKSENELSSIYDSITDFMTVISADYRILRVNRIVEEHYGKDLIGKTCYEVYQGRKEICPNCPTRKAIETKKPAYSFQPETEFSPPVDIYSFPMFNMEGDVIAVVEHGKDITERKRAEGERARLNVELSRKNKELEQILYVTSHDLRTPLINIDGYSKEISRLLKELGLILENNELSADVREDIDVIVGKEIPQAEHYITASTSKMDELLSGLLHISRLGRLESNIEKIDMNNVISEILDSTQYLVDKTGTKIETVELPSCSGDKNQITRLFSNLIDNALKYLDSNRKGVIKVTGKREGNNSVYCVEDNGIGISPDHQEKIFDIFYQLKPKKSTGEGLGLTIVKKIVDINHGKIWVESEPGTGSKFYVSLPN